MDAFVRTLVALISDNMSRGKKNKNKNKLKKGQYEQKLNEVVRFTQKIKK